MQAPGIELWAVVWNVVEFGVSVVQEEGNYPSYISIRTESHEEPLDTPVVARHAAIHLVSIRPLLKLLHPTSSYAGYTIRLAILPLTGDVVVC